MIGRTLSHFKITAKLGEGGMGEVYRATDSKLGRGVAIKILPEAFTTDPERFARFEREAKVLAQLIHQNIAAVYEVGESGATHFIVMELVEGETLSERIARGPIPVDEVLPIALQIAEGLQAAHEAGIIHRDLKPANIKLTPQGQVKILDFGLAKEEVGSASNHAHSSISPTLTAGMTKTGLILGTATYMSPEQARGDKADRRSDLWSFGALLWEALTGRRLFGEPTVSDTLAAVLRAKVEWSTLPRSTPPSVRRLLRRCLERDPKNRLHAAADARLEILEALDGTVDSASPADGIDRRPGRARNAALGALTLVTLGSIVFGAFQWRFARRPLPTIKATIAPPKGGSFMLETTGPGPVAVSPDGRSLAFVARDEHGVERLWVRPLDDEKARALPGTGRPMDPFWSPDSGSLAYFTPGELNRIDLSGGPPRRLCRAPYGKGGSWNQNGTIVFTPAPQAGLHRVSTDGGPSSPLTQPDINDGEHSHRYARFLPDGRRFLFVAVAAPPASNGHALMLGSLDGDPPKEIFRSQSHAEFVAGHLWFVRSGTLLAQAFDLDRGTATGPEIPIVEGVGVHPMNSRAYFSVSPAGVLAYQSADSTDVDSVLVWRDRSGAILGRLGAPADHYAVALAPDGARAVVTTADSDAGLGVQLWMYDTERAHGVQFTFPDRQARSPIWSPDGSRLAWLSFPPQQIVAQSLGNRSSEELIWQTTGGSLAPQDWADDGSSILATSWDGDQTDLWIIPLGSGETPYPIEETPTPFSEDEPNLSPDGQWLAYSSNESGDLEVYLTTFPSGGRKWRVSASGGASPEWSSTGQELFFINPDNVVMVSEFLGTADSVPIAPAQELFQSRAWTTSFNPLAVTPDGQRFLVHESQEVIAPAPIHLVVGWPTILARN